MNLNSMNIRIKNFTIEEYQYWYILTEKWVLKEGKNVWEEYDVNTWYPNTLTRCFERIRHLARLSHKEDVELKNVIEKLQEIDDNFIKQIKSVCQ